MTRNLLLVKLFFLTAALSVGFPSILQAQSPAQPVTLRYKFTVGQVRHYLYDTDVNMLMMTGQTGAGIPIGMTMHATMRQTVKSIRPTDGAATLVSQIESMHMIQNGQEMPTPEAQQAQLNQPITMIMLPTGKILSFSMPNLSGAAAPGMDPKDMLKGMFSGTAFLPAGPVKVGDMWNGAVESSVVGMQMNFISTLMGLTQKSGATLATIQQKQTGTIEKTMTAGLPGTMKMHGDVTGGATQVFDTTGGFIQSSTGFSNTAMTMTFGQTTGGAAMPGMPSAMKTQMQMKFTMQQVDLRTAPASTVVPKP